MLISAIGIVGLLIVAWLMRAWKRHTDRLKTTRDAQLDMPDIWKESGDRLVATMSPYPRPDDGSDAWDMSFDPDLENTDYDPGPPEDAPDDPLDDDDDSLDYDSDDDDDKV